MFQWNDTDMGLTIILIKYIKMFPIVPGEDPLLLLKDRKDRSLSGLASNVGNFVSLLLLLRLLLRPHNFGENLIL